MDVTVAMFAQMHIPAFLTYIVAYGELIGGIMLVVGFCTCSATVFLGVVMIVAIALSYPMGFGAYALPLATFAGIVAIAGAGPGKFAFRCKCKACVSYNKADAPVSTI
jgi:uncharacterized membrane protein YphA (DoxX/SURF4 family)